MDPQAVRDTLRIRLLFAVNVSDWRLSITIKFNLFEFVLRRSFVLQWHLIRCCVVEWGGLGKDGDVGGVAQQQRPPSFSFVVVRVSWVFVNRR